MIISTIVLSVALGLVLGVIYGCSFAQTQRSIFFTPLHSNAFQTRLKTFAFFFLRIVVLALIWRFVLQSIHFTPILIILVFVVSFWLTLLSNKAYWNERT